MRISDWSSDVCSSDLSIRRLGILDPCAERTQEHGLSYGLGPAGYDLRLVLGTEPHPMIKKTEVGPDGRSCLLDRKSDVSGKSVSVRVVHGGCRIIKKKKILQT